MSSSTCELWRIVGLFNNIEDENGVEKTRVKIMRHYGFSNVSWDTNVSTINAGYGINQWGESTYKDGTPYEGADLMRELNTDYLGNTTVGTDGKWYGGRNNSKSGRMYDSLSQTSIDMIQTVKWYTGPSIIDTGYPSSSVMYSNERGPFELASSSSLQGNDTVERTGTWIGKVALINTTDYIYSTSGSSYDEKIICLSDGIYNFFEGDHRCTVYTWMYNSTTMVFLNAYSNKYYKSFVMSTVHSGRSDTEASEPSFLYKPALFLKDEVKIADGDGSESNPYKLVLNE